MDGRYHNRDSRGWHLGLRFFIAGALFGLFLARAPAAEAIDSAPQKGLLVLTNGSILEGVVSLEGDHYRVMLPKGELQVRVTQVDVFCKSLEQAYAHRRQRCRPNSVDAHIEMARWCVQQGMLEHAMEEISEARDLDSHHRMLDVLTRQIEQLRTVVSRDVETEPEPTPTTAENESSQETSVAPVHEIPQWARVEFVRRIQPMLIHSCATGGCHNPDSSPQMQLDREALAGIGNPDLIQQNLESVVRVVDFNDPESSPLLARGLAAHGIKDQEQSQVYTPRQLAILRAWLAQLTSDPLEEIEGASATSTRKESVTQAENSAQHGQHSDKSRRHGKRDPFDPAMFNDQPSEPADEVPPATPLPPVSAQPLDRPTVAVP